MRKARLNPNKWRESANVSVRRVAWDKAVKQAVRAIHPAFPETTMEKRLDAVKRLIDYIAEYDVHPDDRVGYVMESGDWGPGTIDPFDAAQIVAREGDYLREARLIFTDGLRLIGALPPLDEERSVSANHRERELHIAGLLGAPEDDVRRR